MLPDTLDVVIKSIKHIIYQIQKSIELINQSKSTLSKSERIETYNIIAPPHIGWKHP